MGGKMKNAGRYLFENVLSVAAERGADFVKEELLPNAVSGLVEQGGDLLMDYLASAIPGFGPAISNYRTGKKIRNIEAMIQELNKRHEELSNKFQSQSNENKEVLDSIFDLVVEIVSSTSQTEKIKFIINGYSEILNLENPSFDTAYLYLNTLDRLTVLDIEVLKLSYDVACRKKLSDYDDAQSLAETFDISGGQYSSIRDNLFRMGLLENIYGDQLEKDISFMIDDINSLKTAVSELDKFIQGKRKKLKISLSGKKSRLKAKDRYKISKFGRVFLEYFILESE